MIAGTHSGSGKTTLTLGFMAALKRKGFKIAPFKVGPDFIDPGHHTQATGTQSRNLDGWMLSKKYNLENFAENSSQADIAVIEGVMGLFDGYDGKTEAGSTAQMAKWLKAPVLLVVDARSMARSAAAIVKGFEQFDPDLDFAGVLFNRVGSSRHLSYLKEALDGHTTMPCLGGVMRNETLAIPERHLGLVTKEDHQLAPDFLDRIADLLEESLDLENLINRLPEIERSQRDEKDSSAKSGSVSIAVAKDEAFCFYYTENIELLQKSGAEIKYFSPIRDQNVPENIDGIYFGGGYPELYAGQLADNSALRSQIKQKSKEGMPIYGECGGLMYLCNAIGDLKGRNHPMTGCLPFTTRMLPNLKRLGYREVTLTKATLLGSAGTSIRGHEFHYSEIVDEQLPVKTRYTVVDRTGRSNLAEGYEINKTLGSYIHLHWGSCPHAAEAFVAACSRYQKERNTHP